MQGIEDGDGGRYAHSAPVECTASMGARLQERGERDERAERRRISGIQHKYEARERDERAERRRSCKRLHQKGEGEEGKRGRLISIQRHRAR